MDHTTMAISWKDKFRAATIHAAASLGIAGLAALLVFGLWYPYPYRDISGGRDLFVLVVAVDVVLGPLITFAAFSKAKPWPVMRRDLWVIVLLQLSALAYGLWTVYWARPVQLLFAVDRFQVVHAIEVRTDHIAKADARITPMPLTGPQVSQMREPSTPAEKNELVFEATGGLDASMRPDLWLPYGANPAPILSRARPLTELMQRTSPAERDLLQAATQKTGREAAQLRYLPLMSRTHSWTVLVDPQSAAILGYASVEAF